MTVKAIDVDLAGATARLSSPHVGFIDYASVHLQRLSVPASERPAIRAILNWHEGAPPRERLAAAPDLEHMERVDRDLYRRRNELAWFRVDEVPDLQLRFQWDGERLQVTGDFYYRLSADPARDWLKRFIYHRRLPELRQRRFTTLLYYLVYYPCFWWLERQRDVHPIHAAGVETAGGVVVLAGPSGVGKSTLAAGIATAGGARFLSDTFLLHRGASVYPVREPILLDEWSRNWLGEGAGLLQPIDWRYCLNRSGFHWAADRLSAGGKVQLLLFPRRALSHYVRSITAAQSHGRVSAGNLIVNDLRRYLAYAAVLEMLDPSPLCDAREKSLATLVSEAPSYEVGLTRDVSRGELTRILADLSGAAGREFGSQPNGRAVGSA